MRWGWRPALALVTGCSAPNGKFDASVTSDAPGDSTSIATSDQATTEPSTSVGPGGPGSQTTTGSESSDDGPPDGTTGTQEDCRGLVEIQLSSSTKPQLPRALNTDAGPMVFFIDSNRDSGVPLSVAMFDDGERPTVELLPSPWIVDHSFIMAEGPEGLGAVLDVPPTLISANLDLDVLEQRPVNNLGQFATSGMVHIDSDWIIPTIIEENFALLRYPDDSADIDVGIPYTGVAWVAGQGNDDGAAYVYSTGPVSQTCFVLSLEPPNFAFDSTDALTNGSCLSPTLAFEYGLGGVATYHRNDDTGGAQILGQLLGPSGLPLSLNGEFQIAEGLDVAFPVVVRLDTGNYWVAWDHDGALEAALLDGGDPTTTLHTTGLFGGEATFRKRPFIVDGHPALAFHVTSAAPEQTGVHVVIDCDAF